MDYPTRLLCPRGSPGKNTGVGCHALLQRIFLTQESNPLPPLLVVKADALPLTPPGKPEVTDLLTALSDPSASLITYYPPAIRKNTLCQFS